MILSYVCIIIYSAICLSGKAERQLSNLKLSSFAVMILLFLSAMATLLPNTGLQSAGLDYLSIILMAVAGYTVCRSGARRLIPIFGGIFGVAAMSMLYQYATRQLVIGAWGNVLYMAVMVLTTIIVSNGHESFSVAVLGITLSQIVMFALPPDYLAMAFQQIGGIIMMVILLVIALYSAVGLIKKRVRV